MVPSARQQSGTASYPSPRRWQGCDPPAAARRRNRWNTEYAIETPVSRMVSTTSSGSTDPSVPRASSVVKSATERPLSYVVPAGRHLASRSSLQLCIPTLRHNAAAALIRVKALSSRQPPRVFKVHFRISSLTLNCPHTHRCTSIDSGECLFICMIEQCV